MIKLLKKIWNKLILLFSKRHHSSEELISEEKALLLTPRAKDELCKQLEQANKSNEKQKIIKQIAQHETAETIIAIAENLKSINYKINTNFFYEFYKLRDDLSILKEKIISLNLKKSSIKKINYPDTSFYAKKNDELRNLLLNNKFDYNAKISNILISEYEKHSKQYEDLFHNKKTLLIYNAREQKKIKQFQKYERNTYRELGKLEEFLNLDKLIEAKAQINFLSRTVKSNHKEGIARLSNAIARLEKKEFNVFKKHQIELIKRQTEASEIIRISNEKLEKEKIIIKERSELLRKNNEKKKIEKERKLRELLDFKFNWRDFEKVLKKNGIKRFYHFTDIRNLNSIIENKGLYSWFYCDMNKIDITVPGGSSSSRYNDKKNGKKDFVRIAFNKDHPMLYSAKKEGRINQEKWLFIDIKVAYFKNTEFSDKNAAAFKSYKPKIGSKVSNLKNVRFDILNKRYFDLEEYEKKFYQAEVLVKTWIPLKYITNLKE